jgi:DegV family protein with EDD domain
MSYQSSAPVAVVTDSTAYLPGELLDRYAIQVVPIHVAIGGVSGREGIDVTPGEVARALRERRVDVTTSRPTPDEFTARYAELFVAGVSNVVSVHVSARLSGTYDAAQLAAEGFDGNVTVIDSRSTGMGLGFPVLAGAQVAEAGGSVDEVAQAVERAISGTSIFFYVHTLEFLRRGGRIGAAEALLGTALAVKPILHVTGGEVLLKEKVRTAGKALARLEELVLAAAGDAEVDLVVHHLDGPQRAADLLEHLRGKLPALRDCYTSQVGAAVGAHVGPGLLAAVVYRRPAG